MNFLRIGRTLAPVCYKTHSCESITLTKQTKGILSVSENVSSIFSIKSHGIHSLTSTGPWRSRQDHSRLLRQGKRSGLRDSISCVQGTQTRTFLSFLRKKKKSLEEYQKMDGVAEHYDLVYHGNSLWYIHLALGSVQTSMFGITGCLAADFIGMPVLNLLEEIMTAPVEAGCFIIFSTMICIAIIQLARQYPFRIYYSELEHQFIIILSGMKAFSTRKLIVQPGEVKSRQAGQLMRLLPWSPNSYKCSSQNLLLFIDSFKYPVYFNMLLGYQ